MQAPETSESLIYKLRDTQHQEVWSEFVQIYQPLIYNVAISRGLQHNDALDTVQEVFIAVSKAIDRFDPRATGGSFRGWLSTITRNLAINRMSRGGRSAASGDSRIQSMLNTHPDETLETVTFDLQLKRQLFRWAADKVKARVAEDTWNAFWLTAVEGVPIETVAQRLGKSNGAIRIARCRVIAQLKEQAKQFHSSESSTSHCTKVKSDCQISLR